VHDLELLVSPEDLEKRSHNLAIDAAVHVYKKFGWGPDRSLLKEKQPRFSYGRLEQDRAGHVSQPF
jgi:hypothetical protein